MNIKFNFKFVISFLALMFMMHEAHEIAHTALGRIICGGWGERDFNVWGLAEGCNQGDLVSMLPTYIGPIFTFIMIWVGAFLLKPDNSVQKKSFGFALIFANMPVARIVTAAFGGGDEVYATNVLLDNYSLAWAIGLMAILMILAYPLYRAFVSIQKKRVSWFLLFFFAPMIIDLVVVLGLMNTLLEKGILADYWILGSPILVSLWTIFVILVFILMRKHIFTLFVK
ncbi:hypothetical protein [Maribacter halichondriae]|uniref:hypothetical protein n=1 Tax=Maribacter halichondriae TaxID=2980554 RepID=UPI00235A0B28|nr:hypothetical protein [Maribacter sp. Hal144]